MAGIYLHIPFCETRCSYCSFYSTTSLTLMERYKDALVKELKQRKDYVKGESIRTIYFGGGTPSLLPTEFVDEIIHYIYKVYCVEPNPEITIEANPEDVTPAWLCSIRDTGANRLSLGIQTFDDRRLKFINRRHSASKALDAVRMAKAAGFGNISIDLMFGFPGETIADWENDVRRAIALDTQHISAYALSIEEGTPLHRKLTKGEIEEIDEETYRTMYDALADSMRSNGYEHYEISNFAKPGFRSRHNSSYWNSSIYIGIGAAAHSFDGKSRQWNPSSIMTYIHNMEEGLSDGIGVETLDDDMRYDEYVMTRLRTCEGVSTAEIEKAFGHDRLAYFHKAAQPHIQTGMMELTDGNRLRIARQGIFISDDIMSDLMS